MTVDDLIAALRELPPDARVVVDGYEGGFDDPHILGAVVILGEDRGGYSGQHEEAYIETDGTVQRVRSTDTPCVLLSRSDYSEFDAGVTRTYADAVTAVENGEAPVDGKAVDGGDYSSEFY